MYLSSSIIFCSGLNKKQTIRQVPFDLQENALGKTFFIFFSWGKKWATLRKMKRIFRPHPGPDFLSVKRIMCGNVPRLHSPFANVGLCVFTIDCTQDTEFLTSGILGQCSVVQCSLVQCSVVQCRVPRCSKLQGTGLLESTLFTVLCGSVF